MKRSKKETFKQKIESANEEVASTPSFWSNMMKVRLYYSEGDRNRRHLKQYRGKSPRGTRWAGRAVELRKDKQDLMRKLPKIDERRM